MTAVEVKGIVKTYDLGKTQVHALRGVDIAVGVGEFATIAGPSGSGKSTLLNIIGCIDRPTRGEVWIGEVEVSGLPDAKLNGIRSRTIGFIFQSFNLIPVLNVYENIELPLLIRRDISPKERRLRVERFMEEVGLKAQLRQRPAELSGGERQRVAVARALAAGPKVVLADEPTANLDSATGLEIIECMHAINRKENVTFIFSSHDPKIIGRADRVFRLEDGRKTGEEAP
jgi:putative ABC transport system ATP-binding protein